MIGHIFFAIWRIQEFITLIPLMGMLAYFVHGYTDSNQLTPTFFLVPFIASVLALAWVIFTVRPRYTHGLYIFIVDLAFAATFLAGAILLRFISGANCANFSSTTDSASLNLGVFGVYGAAVNNPFGLDLNKSCAMTKAVFAFCIIEVLLFFVTAFISIFLHRKRDRSTVVVERRYSNRSTTRPGSHHSSHYGQRGAGSRSNSGSRHHSHNHSRYAHV